MGRVVRYLKSAQWSKDFPAGDKPEVAITGRSNAGKSSFLNQWAKSLVAKVSQAPGKTRLVNFFDVGETYRWVDLPGYGYATRGADERDDWGPMIEQYLALRDNMVGAILVMDVRRDWTEDEENLKQFLENVDRPLCVVATKTDKLKPVELKKRLRILKEQSQCEVHLISNLRKTGADEVEEYCYRTWVKPYLDEMKQLKRASKEEATLSEPEGDSDEA